MKLHNTQKIFFGLFAAALVISACAFPEKEDPFSRLPEEEIQTLEGEVFPFSVSVATRATHRLEKDEKLVAYLASDIVRLNDFVGRQVEIKGVWRTEKMREIFWVESIRLLDIGQNKTEELEEQLFSTKRFSFLYPTYWEHSLSPNGVVHFVEKSDSARRVFLTFSVEELTREDRSTDPNVLIANLAGTKKITTDELDRERQEVVLFSNEYDQKYRFVFTSQFEAFEKKKEFFQLLNSFVEGEEKVRQAEAAYQRRVAELESEKIKEEAMQEEGEKPVSSEPKEEKKESFLEKLFGDEQTESTEEEPLNEQENTSESDIEVEDEKTSQSEESPPSDTSEQTTPPQGEEGEAFTNLIDERAFSYESSYYQLRMKVPWGYWFRNFGPSEGAITRIGFSDQEFSDPAGAKFWLEIVRDDTPPTQASEKIQDGQMTITFPRSENSFYRFSGSVQFRDAMKSIQSTVEKF